MNTCSDIEPLLSAYFDDELAPEQRDRVALHLEECGECREILAGIEWVEQVAADAEMPPVDEQQWARVWEGIRAKQDASVAHAAGSGAIRRRKWLRPLTGLAAAAVLLISLGLVYILNPQNDGGIEPAWDVISYESGSADVSVLHSYNAEADMTVIWVLPASGENGAGGNGEST